MVSLLSGVSAEGPHEPSRAHAGASRAGRGSFDGELAMRLHEVADHHGGEALK